MGIQYRLVDDEAREFFDLGKGAWFDVFRTDDSDRAEVPGETALADILRADVFPLYWTPDTCRRLASHIVQWARGRRLRLENDYDCDSDVTFVMTGDRFEPFKDEAEP